MGTYLVRRLGSLLVVVVGVSLVAFLLLRLTPQDPVLVILGEGAEPADIERLRGQLGLDQPLAVQYLRYVSRLARGDFGTSILEDRPVLGMVLEKLPNTLILTVGAVTLGVFLGVPAGMVSAVRRNSAADYLLMALALVGLSMPLFWVGILLIILFAVTFPLFPISGIASADQGLAAYLWYLALPAATLGSRLMGLVARMTRSSVLEVLNEEYILTARMKGLPDRVVFFRHAFKNALVPVITVVGLQFGALLGGSVITEVIFGWPGVGRLMVEAIRANDYPTVQGGLIIIASLFSFVNLLVDVSYAYADPRIRLG